MAKFNVDKAKEAGMSDEAIQAYLSANPTLEPKGNYTGNLFQDIKANAGQALSETIDEAAPAVRSVTSKIASKTPKIPLVFPGVYDTQKAVQDAGDLVADMVTPTGLAVNAATLGAGTVAKPILKGSSKALGKVLSGKNTKQIGRLFDDPGALIEGGKEAITKGSQKAFGAVKKALNIRPVKEGTDALESAQETVKKLIDNPELRQQFNSRVDELLKAGASQRKAMKYAADELGIPEKALEARQAIDKLSPKKLETPDVQALRKGVNTVLDNVAPEIRAIDPKIARAKLGQEFLQFLPEGFTRKLVSTAALGASPFAPAVLGTSAAMSPAATGLGTAAAGVASKAIEGATRTGLRRALISAMASRANKKDEE